jgi:uncharacterized iron-regulated membrane protein
MRKLIFNLHLYTALIAGLFVVILGVTGSIMAFEDDLDRIFNPGLFKVEPGTQAQPIPVLQDALKKAYPGQRFNGLHVPSSPDEAYYAQARTTQIFLNGYTGQIIGTRQLPTTLMQIHTLHLRLLMGKPGANIVCAVGIVLVWLVASGIYLWWPLKRASVKLGSSLRRFTFDLHNAAGIYSATFLLVLALTGIFVHFDEDIGNWIHRLANTTPPLRNLPSVVQPGVKPITPDRAIEIARTALPGASPISYSGPANPKGSYSVAMRYPEDLTPGGRSWVNIDQYSGNVLFVESSRTAPAGTKFIIENRAIHTGDIWGYPTKILMSLSSLMVVIQAITGYYMWWKKLRVRARAPEAERDSIAQVSA